MVLGSSALLTLFTAPFCPPASASDDAVDYESLRSRIASGEQFRHDDLAKWNLTKVEKKKLVELYLRMNPPSPVRVRTPPPNWQRFSRSTSTSTNSWNWFDWVTILYSGGVVICLALLMRPKNGIKRRWHSFLKRVALFQCSECSRPVCLLGAQQASVFKIARTSPEFSFLDEADLTPRQRVSDSPTWVEVRCIHCNAHLCFDEIGIPAAQIRSRDSKAAEKKEERWHPGLARSSA